MMWEGVICKCVKVGEAEKIGDTRNVDTINLSQDVVTVSLMLFYSVYGRKKIGKLPSQNMVKFPPASLYKKLVWKMVCLWIIGKRC